MEYLIVNGELCHYGIKGQKWGVRRWQDADGSFNSAGKARYFGDGAGENYHKIGKSSDKKKEARSGNGAKKASVDEKKAKEKRAATAKKVAIAGAAVAAAGLAAYGGYKLYQNKQAHNAMVETMRKERQNAAQARGQAQLMNLMKEWGNDPNVLSYSITDNRLGVHASGHK